MRRVLADGGIAVLQIPVDEKRAVTFKPKTRTALERLRLFRQTDHMRLYGLDIADRIKEAGFMLRIIDFGKGLSEGEKKYYGLTQDNIYSCTRGFG